jgi:hypothetical protein
VVVHSVKALPSPAHPSRVGTLGQPAQSLCVAVLCGEGQQCTLAEQCSMGMFLSLLETGLAEHGMTLVFTVLFLLRMGLLPVHFL